MATETIPGVGRFAPARRHPVAAYVGITLAVSWGIWIPLLTALGDSPLATVALVPGAFGPGVAAAVVTWLRGESVREWLGGALAWRRPLRWYGLAVGVPVAVSAVVLAVVVGLWAPIQGERVPTVAAVFAFNVVFASLLGGGQEEFGWRGFALPHLQARYDALTASIVIGAVWALWHAPLFVFDVYAMDPALYAVAVVGFAVVFTWYYNGSGGCLPGAILLHGTVNAAVNVPAMLVGGREAVPVPYIGLVAVAFWLVALGLLARYGRDTLADGEPIRPSWARSK